MKTRKITESQLREMIKESLEESIVEIGEDDERSKLSRLGSKRTPEQTKRYKQLLESKLRRLHEEVGQQQVLPGFGSSTEEERKILQGGQAKLKLATPGGKKFGNVFGQNTKLQTLLGDAESAKEIADMILSILEDVITDQAEEPAEKGPIGVKAVIDILKMRLPQLVQFEKKVTEQQ